MTIFRCIASLVNSTAQVTTLICLLNKKSSVVEISIQDRSRISIGFLTHGYSNQQMALMSRRKGEVTDAGFDRGKTSHREY